MTSIQFIRPCVLTVLTAGFLTTVGWWAFYFVQGPNGTVFTPAPSISPVPPTPSPLTPSPPIMVSLGTPTCPDAVCLVRNRTCAEATICVLDELRPVCSLGVCNVAHECVAAAADVTFQCACTCPP